MLQFNARVFFLKHDILGGCFQPVGQFSLLHCDIAVWLVSEHGAYHEGASSS